MLNIPISFLGRLGRDPSLKYLEEDRVVCNMRIATGKDDDTLWFDVAVWGKQAEACAQYLGKGSQVFISGRFSVRDYESKEGEARYSLKVDANVCEFAGSKGDDERREDDREASPPADEEIPF